MSDTEESTVIPGENEETSSDKQVHTESKRNLGVDDCKDSTRCVKRLKTNNENELEKKEQNNLTGKHDKNENTKGNPKSIFGSTSNFNSGFGVTNKSFGSSIFNTTIIEKKKNEPNDKIANDKDEMKVSLPKTSAFGSGLAFQAGFKTLDKENNKTEDKKCIETKDNADKLGNISVKKDVESLIKLTKQEIMSGEETEKSKYQANAKLYQLTNIKNGWKERGIGSIHVNINNDTNKSRIVMRSRGILKVILNLSLVKGISVKKGFPGSMQSEKFVRIMTVNENKDPVQYALRTANPDIATELYNSIVELIPAT